MSARSEYSDVAAMADELQQPNDFSLALAEIDELRGLFDRARAYAKACGLFTGGHVMDTPTAVVDRMNFLEAGNDRLEAEIDELREANARLRHTLYGSDDLLRGVSRR